jgi:hypothetical protein
VNALDDIAAEVNKIVNVPVERIVEVPFETLIIREIPVEKIVKVI